ncbi:AAA family ATPase [Alteromonas abrolhosensis]|uniref:AAA family ATPase n=1 Tax=Alteromonas abrolhosensis TaxID=1892904 RepID=UPI00096B8B0E|nr:AAA family ATPase [Alteromonas abrolhosensis]|tara:strand:+ start:1096 stop:2181 length:1086 start_codon:yes stop_codon:yes gene_type:complete
MISNINVKNFKCFKEQSFYFAPLTIFCGANSAGKSTAIQAVLSVVQNKENIFKGCFNTFGSYFNFGKVVDLFNHNAESSDFEITIDDLSIRANVTIKEKQDYVLKLTNEFKEINTKFQHDFVYLCAERFGPRASYDVNRSSEKLDLGIYGEYALSEFARFEERPCVNQVFAKSICSHLKEPSEPEKLVFTDVVVRQAMKKIYPSFEMKVTEAENIDKVYHLYGGSSSKDFVRPINTGFGVSYVLPIIIAASTIEPGGMLIVENPEVHLHPSAQSQLIGILATLSQSGVQVIIETHSDHIVNGLRVYAKENSLDINSNIIYSISEQNGERKVKEIRIDSDGNFTDLDIGFFDQINNDLMKLF